MTGDSDAALPVINSCQCLGSFHTDCLSACQDHSLTCAQAVAGFDSTLLSFILSILPRSPSLFICIPPLPPSGEVLLAAVQNFYFILVIDSQGDAFLSFAYYAVFTLYLPLMVVIPRLPFLN